VSSTIRALALVACLTGGACGAQQEPSVQVRTEPVQRAPIAERVTAYGIVTLAPEAQTDLMLPYGARITRLRVSAGQAVRRGEELFAVVADAGAVLSMQQAHSALTLARGELERTQVLFAQRMATRSQVAAAEKALADAEQALAAQNALGISAAERVIAAPFDGVVVRVGAVPGDRIAGGTVVLQLARSGGNPSPVRVVLGVEPSLRRAVPVGAGVVLTSLAAAAGSAEAPLAGRVGRVLATLNPQTRMVDVQVDLAGRDAARLMPGEPVRGAITARGASHWIVPRAALLRDARGAYVYQVDRGRARRVDVELRVDDGKRLGVDGPLDVGQPLVVQGNYQLADGMAVREGGS